MDNDDRQTGYILSRREVLTLAGVAGAVMLSGCVTGGPGRVDGGGNATPALNDEAATVQGANTATAIPDCVIRPETTEGPYYVDDDLTRSDIRADPATGAVKDGAPLVLTFNVSQVSESGCSPIEGARVEIWHCDALGVYSDVSDPGFSTRGQKWLRGTQVTDADGQATFTTIYPGWYSGRAVHIHCKVRPDANTAFTSQLFFDDQFTAQVFAREPYASRGRPDTPNSMDAIYQDLLLLNTRESGAGYAATFPLGIDQSALNTE